MKSKRTHEPRLVELETQFYTVLNWVDRKAKKRGKKVTEAHIGKIMKILIRKGNYLGSNQ